MPALFGCYRLRTLASSHAVSWILFRKFGGVLDLETYREKLN